MTPKRLTRRQGHRFIGQSESCQRKGVVFAVGDLDAGEGFLLPMLSGIVPLHVTVLTRLEALLLFSEIAVPPFQVGCLLISRLNGLPVYNNSVAGSIIVENGQQNIVAGA